MDVGAQDDCRKCKQPVIILGKSVPEGICGTGNSRCMEVHRMIGGCASSR